MKKIMIVMLFAIFCGPALAGEAVIPYWVKSPTDSTCITVSNISNNDVNFKVTLYSQDGAKYLGAIEFVNNISALDQEAVLPAKQASTFCVLKTSGYSYGHGEIVTRELEGNTGKSFVVAHSRQVYHSGGFHSSTVPINGGMPF